jgi:hypothetical protein
MYHCCLTSNEQHCIYIHEFTTKTSLQTMQIVFPWVSEYDSVSPLHGTTPPNGSSASNNAGNNFTIRLYDGTYMSNCGIQTRRTLLLPVLMASCVFDSSRVSCRFLEKLYPRVGVLLVSKVKLVR